jgi:hypothetical protein
MNDTIERLDNVAMHLLTENATLSRVIRHCKERQEEVMARLKHIRVEPCDGSADKECAKR